MKVAPLDDYQNVAPSRADWSGATKRAVTSALRDNVGASFGSRTSFPISTPGWRTPPSSPATSFR